MFNVLASSLLLDSFDTNLALDYGYRIMNQPLADVLRPSSLEDMVGQSNLVGENGIIRLFVEHKTIPSMIFWGPPATGKTTLARIISQSVNAECIELSAVLDGKEALRTVINSAKQDAMYDKATIVFVDEIHRWNKAQQDALLPHVESGLITLIGATTENPSFSIISPLISRCQIIIFDQLSVVDIAYGLRRAYIYLSEDSTERWRGETHILPTELDEQLNKIAALSDHDIRYAIRILEFVYQLSPELDDQAIAKVSQRALNYDQSGEEHYNLISAVHKSLRSSNATAGVYWIVRMLEGGEDPLYIARRLVRFASEDIGNANPNALLLANQVYDACAKLGMPECGVHLVQLAQYLADSRKSNAAYRAYSQAQTDVRTKGSLPVPLHFRNASTQLMKDIGYGKGYEYDHNLETGTSNQQCMPDGLVDRSYFD